MPLTNRMHDEVAKRMLHVPYRIIW